MKRLSPKARNRSRCMPVSVPREPFLVKSSWNGFFVKKNRIK